MLYVRTAAPTVYGVDSADLTTAAYLLGISHPPGAPTYLLIANAFTRLPIGDVGYRVNLLSALSGALAAYFIYRCVVRLGSDAWLGVATAWLVATSYYLWTASVAAEVYALQACHFTALLLLALRWRDTRSLAGFCLLGLLAGLGLGIHLSLAFALPGLAVVALAPTTSAPARPAVLLAGVLCGVLGAAVYAYVPLRHLSDLPLNPARDYWQVDLASRAGFWWMISGEGFRRHFADQPSPALPLQLARFASLLWSTFLGLPSLLALLGIAVELRRQRWVHGGLLLVLFGYLAFYLAYSAGDKQNMILPVYVLWGMWIGFGARAAAGWLSERIGLGAAPLVAPALLGCVVALLLLVNFRYIDASADRSARARGESILAALEPNAVFVGAWSDLRLVEYLQQVEGQRRDVVPDDVFFVSDEQRTQRIATALRSGRPVYVTACRDLPDASLQCVFDARCQCYRLQTSADPS